MENKVLDGYIKEAFGKKAPFSINVYQNTIDQILKIRPRKDRLEMFESFFLYAFYGIEEPFEEICKKYAYVSIYNMVKRQRIGWENGTGNYQKKQKNEEKNEQKNQKSSFSIQKNVKTESVSASLSYGKVSFTPTPIYKDKDIIIKEINKENVLKKHKRVQAYMAVHPYIDVRDGQYAHSDVSMIDRETGNELGEEIIYIIPTNKYYLFQPTGEFSPTSPSNKFIDL